MTTTPSAASDGAIYPSEGSGPAEGSGKISNADATASVMKAIFGAGCFALPWAFANGGVALTTASMLFTCLLSLKTLTWLFRARNIALALDKTIDASKVQNYVDIADVTLGRGGGTLTRFTMCFTAFGVASAYLVFIASTLATITQGLSSLPAALQSDKMLVYAVSPIMVLLAFLRDFSVLSSISILGNLSVLVGMAFVLVDATKSPAGLASLPMSAPKQFSAYVGSVAFLFLVHFALPDIESNMQDKDKFVPSAIVGFSLCAMIALIFGVVGAVGYGPDVKSVAIAMLKGGAVAVTVKLLLCANVLATFPLIVRSSFTTVENALGGMSVASSNVMRTAYVFLAAFCGASIPSFGKLVGLVGGVACTFLSLTLPVFMLYNMSRKSIEHALSWGEKAVMAFILLISFAIMVSVTIA